MWSKYYSIKGSVSDDISHNVLMILGIKVFGDVRRT